MRRARRGGLALLLALGLAATAAARSPLVAEMETLATRYHEAPARLDAVKDGLAQAARQEPDAETWIALARACFIWGDVRATTDEQRLAAYAEGREAARRAVELAPRSALAHLLYGINTGRWGQTRGVLRSLFLLVLVAVPFVLFRSWSTKRPSSGRIRKCWLEIATSGSTMSLARARPTDVEVWRFSSNTCPVRIRRAARSTVSAFMWLAAPR